MALEIQRKSLDQESLPSVALPSSPQEEKFWTTPIGPSRTLHFADSLMDELVDLGDISTTSFQSPLPVQPTSKLGQLDSFRATTLFDASFMTNITPEIDHYCPEHERKDLESILGVNPMTTPTIAPHLDNKDMDKKPDNEITDTPSARQRRIRVNIEVERITVSIECILSDIG